MISYWFRCHSFSSDKFKNPKNKGTIKNAINYKVKNRTFLNLQDQKYYLPSTTTSHVSHINNGFTKIKRTHPQPKQKLSKSPIRGKSKTKRRQTWKKEPARKSNPPLGITKQQTPSLSLAPPPTQREYFRVSIDDRAFTSRGRKLDLRTRSLTQISPILNPDSSFLCFWDRRILFLVFIAEKNSENKLPLLRI